MRDSLGNPAKELTLLDGDSFYLGSAHLLLVLSVPDLPRRPVRSDYDSDEHEPDLFDVDAWLDEHEVQSDPAVSPIFDPRPDPFDDEPLHARPRSQRPVRRPEPPRRASGSDSVSPIFDADRIVSNKPGQSGRTNPRAFLDDEPDDLFKTDEKF